jgi:hypothetical protein
VSPKDFEKTLKHIQTSRPRNIRRVIYSNFRQEGTIARYTYTSSHPSHVDHQEVPQADLRSVVDNVLAKMYTIRINRGMGPQRSTRTSLYCKHTLDADTSTGGPSGMWHPCSPGWPSASPASFQLPGCVRPRPRVLLCKYHKKSFKLCLRVYAPFFIGATVRVSGVIRIGLLKAWLGGNLA